jgi:hypothetical protein
VKIVDGEVRGINGNDSIIIESPSTAHEDGTNANTHIVDTTYTNAESHLVATSGDPTTCKAVTHAIDTNRNIQLPFH